MKKSPALAYLRTSSAANSDGDSPFRQSTAISAFAARAGLEIVGCWWDAAVSGADPIETRNGFAALLNFAEEEGIGVVIVEDADRFARSVVAQELGVLVLLERGIKLITSTGQEMTDNSDPVKVMMRQIAGAFAQFEKARLVSKLKAARDRRSIALGRRIEGRKRNTEKQDGLLREAKRLSRRSPRTGQRRSLREIAAALAALGYLTATGQPFSPTQVQRLLATT